MKSRLVTVSLLSLLLLVSIAVAFRATARGSAPSGSDPATSELTSFSASSVALSGTTAYVAIGNQLHAVDISVPASPAALSVTEFPPFNVNHLEALGDLLYVASDGGLQIVTFATPETPTQLAYTDIMTPVYGVAVQGDYIYATGYEFNVFSQMDPTSPAVVGSIPSQRGDSIDLQGAYVVQAQDWGNTVDVVSVSDPTAPSLVGSCPAPAPEDLDAVGEYVYVADYFEGLLVISTTTPTSPTIVGEFQTYGYGESVAGIETHAYVCSTSYSYDGTGYLYDISVADPEHPQLVGELFLTRLCRDLVVDDQYVYMATAEGLLIVSRSGLQIVGSYPLAPSSVMVAGPGLGVAATPYTFTATAQPITTTTPITWTWEATDQPLVTRQGGVSDSMTFTWDTPGSRTITVTAVNMAGAAVGSRTILIGTGNEATNIFLPLALRNAGRCPYVPTLLSPTNGSQLSTLIPLYQWEVGDVPEGTEMRLQIAEDPSFTKLWSTLHSMAYPGTHSFRFPDNLTPAETYYWRAYYICGDVQGRYSPAWSLTAGSGGTILPPPSLVSPADEATAPTTPITLRWSPVAGAQGYVVHWREVGWGGYNYSWDTDTEFVLNYVLTPGLAYEWWVTAYNDYALGADSATWQFTVPVGTAAEPIAISGRVMMVGEDGTFVVVEE